MCHGILVETCDELQAAFDLTKTQDVVIEIPQPYANIDCVNFTTMSMDSNSLTVGTDDSSNIRTSDLDIYEVRFEVTGGSTLSWEPNVQFHGSDQRDVDGGGVYVGEGSSVHFLKSLEMTYIRIHSVTDEGSDFASYYRSGGCVYTDGYFRVDGATVLTDCHNSGGGESDPGPGGGMYVGPLGSVWFNDTLEITESSAVDDAGVGGGGIYNEGNVQIFGDTKFGALRSHEGGAIYNAVGGQFSFKNGVLAEFSDTLTPEGTAGALYNEGYLEFSGPALFYESGNPSIYISADGITKLSKRSVFWGNDGNNEPFIEVESGGKLVIPNSVTFVGNEDSDCSTVYYEENDSCL